MTKETTKPWYASRGVIGALVVIIATALSIFGKPEQAAAVTEESGTISGLYLSIITIIGAIVALWGRIAAKDEIAK